MENRPTLLWVHGWGFGPGFWRHLQREMPSWSHHTLDLGFYGQEYLTIPEDGLFVAIGHSTGFLWILKQLEDPQWRSRCLAIVAINGFARFAWGEDFPHGVDARVLKKMDHDLKRDPQGVLAEFQRLGGGPGLLGWTPPDKQKLAQGLAWLAQWDCRPVLTQWEKPWLALANRDDAVVTEAMTRDSFEKMAIPGAGRLFWFDRGGHFLTLLHNPHPQAAQLQTFLAGMI